MSIINYTIMVVALFIAILFDISRQRIPNILTVSATLIGLIITLMTSSISSLGSSLIGLILGFVLILPGYLLHATGAGDVKLMAMVGCFLGYPLILSGFISFVIAGLISAVVFTAYAHFALGATTPFTRYGAMLLTFIRTGRVAYVPPKPGEAMGKRLPMAPAISFGAITAPFLQLP